MTNKGKSLSSVARALASLKSFYHYMVRVGAVKEEPTKTPFIFTNSDVSWGLSTSWGRTSWT